MASDFGYNRDRWHETITKDDKLNIRFPGVGAMLSIGGLHNRSFLPCVVTQSSEIFVAVDHAYDFAIGKSCRADAMRAYVRYLQRAGELGDSILNCYALEQVYNRVIWACACGIPQPRMAQDLSNLRTYWLPRLTGRINTASADAYSSHSSECMESTE